MAGERLVLALSETIRVLRSRSVVSNLMGFGNAVVGGVVRRVSMVWL